MSSFRYVKHNYGLNDNSQEPIENEEKYLNADYHLQRELDAIMIKRMNYTPATLINIAIKSNADGNEFIVLVYNYKDANGRMKTFIQNLESDITNKYTRFVLELFDYDYIPDFTDPNVAKDFINRKVKLVEDPAIFYNPLAALCRVESC